MEVGVGGKSTPNQVQRLSAKDSMDEDPAMAAKDADANRNRALLDQLNLRAGYLALGSDDYDKAIDFLEKVSLSTMRINRNTCL